MVTKHVVKLTANFERNLETIETFLKELGIPEAFDDLLNELTDAVIPNLERFPSIGRSILDQPVGSLEAEIGVQKLRKQLNALAKDGELREYVTPHYLLLYVKTADAIYLLAIRHHRQLSFDLAAHWPS